MSVETVADTVYVEGMRLTEREPRPHPMFQYGTSQRTRSNILAASQKAAVGSRDIFILNPHCDSDIGRD